MFDAWDRLDVGGVVINDVPSYRVDNMPYGGVKDSAASAAKAYASRWRT
jgi:acyl-CoA reductase-like NAD-dependent aldehyde dehydrogenase